MGVTAMRYDAGTSPIAPVESAVLSLTLNHLLKGLVNGRLGRD